jgi:hypothetical protein
MIGILEDEDDDEHEHDSSNFGIWVKTDGKSWSFRLRALMDDDAEVGYPSRFQHSTPRRQALRFPAIEKVGRNAS